MKKAILKLDYTCNNNCSFCHAAERHKAINSTLPEIKRKIDLAQVMGCQQLLLSGGEPTIYRKLSAVTSYLKEKHLAFGLITNARMLSNVEFLEKLQHDGLVYVYVSFLSADPRIQELLTGTNSFEQVSAGIRNCVKYNLDVKVNITLTRQNVSSLMPTVKLLQRLGVKCVKISFVEPKGRARRNFTEIVPKFTEVIPLIERVLNTGLSGMVITLDGFPYCQIRKYLEHTDDLQAEQILYMSEADEAVYYPTDYGAREKTDKCMICSLADKCPGVYSYYLRAYGDNELTPVRQLVSNSMLFERIGRIKGDICEKLVRSDENRSLVLKGKANYLYRTNTTDFNIQIIRKIKENGRYFFVAKEQGPYTAQLKKIRLANQCKNCRKSVFCPGYYEFHERNVLLEDEEYFQGKLKELKGKILDVGCGRVPYKAVVLGLLKDGKNSYLGIDPQGQKVSKLKIVRGQIEEHRGPADTYDNILIVRSWNHIKDISTALKNIRRMLKKGGRLLIWEDMVHGVLKDKKITKRGKKFEHFRNHDIRDVSKMLEKSGLSVKEQNDLTKSNLWYLSARKK